MSQGANAVANGKQLETDVVGYLKSKDYNVVTKKRIYWSDVNFYVPDVIVDGQTVVELKYQEVSGSAQNKLSQAVAELQWMHNEVGYDALLVISGSKLKHVVDNDPAFKIVRLACPNVQIIDIDTFYSKF